LVLGGQAMAADLSARMPLKAAVAVPRYYSWTGCHVGGHIGAGWGNAQFSEPLEPAGQYVMPAGSSEGVDKGAGFLGGVGLGCDYQFASNWVIGAAGDFSWADIHGSQNVADPFFNAKSGSSIQLTAKTEWLATATMRLGYAWDRFMLYGKGGAAWSHDKYSIQNLAFFGNPNSTFCANAALTTITACNPSGATTRLGWTLGLGLEWAFADNWSANVEFDHYDFGSRNVMLTDQTGVTFVPVLAHVPASGPFSIKDRTEAVKVGVSYRFWTGGH
ncbi:MAG TPA: outer membrane beta-barrel protein, partial [Xanthobacteraceae bacterium]